MKLILVLATACLSFASCGQNIPASKVPSIVQNAVQLKFMSAVNMEWDKKKSFYEAEFNIDSTEYTAVIDPAGKMILYKMDVRPVDLPLRVTAAIQKDHADWTIDEVEKIEKDGLVFYQVELESKDKKDKELVFLADGTISKQFNYIK